MAGAGGHGALSTNIQMYKFQLLCCVLALDFDDLLLVLGLDTCGAH